MRIIKLTRTVMPAQAGMTNAKVRGVTLIELVIFIAIVAIAFSGVMIMFVSANRYNADPMIKIKTVELGQSLLEEIMLKSFDHNTPVGGGCVQPTSNTRCTSGITASNALGSEGSETRASYNDVDDFHDIAYCGAGTSSVDTSCSGPCTSLINESGGDISADYPGFAVCIRVAMAGSELNSVSPAATSVLNNDAKRIDVIITDPAQSRFTFSAYRLNF